MQKKALLIGLMLIVSGTFIGGLLGVPGEDGDGESWTPPGIDQDRGYLGVFLREVNSEDVQKLGLPAEKGVYLTGIAEGSPAEEAGLKKDDVIIEYQSLPVISVRQFQRLVGETPPGRTVDLGIYRGRRVQSLSVKIGSGDPFRSAPRAFRLPPPSGDGSLTITIPERITEGLRDYVPGFFRRGPVLGIEGAAMTSQMAEFMGVSEEEGVLVTSVMKDSPAESAGLKAGDLITAVNGKTVRGPGDLRAALKEGSSTLDLVRNRKKISLEVDIASPRDRDAGRETFRM